MPHYGTVRKPTYKLFVAMKGRNGGPTGALELSNVITITTQKSIGDPAGAFEIVLDGTKIAGGKRLYEMVTPNDYVEMRLGVQPRYPHPIAVMRGFVDNVRIVEDPGATPSRQIVLSGRDYGKAWLVVKLLNVYPPQTSNLPFLLKNVYAFDNVVNIPLTDFFNLVMDHVVRPYIDFQQRATGGASDGGVKSFALFTDIPAALKLKDIQANQAFDAVYNWLRVYQNMPWIEMFSRDEPDAPKFILRWARTRTSDFRQIDPFDGPLVQMDQSHTITYRDDLMADNLGRSDNDVYNWFFTGNAATNQIDEDIHGAVWVPGENAYIAGESIDKFALRKLHPNITFLDNVEGQGEEEIKAAVAKHKNLAALFNLWLVKMYGFNEQLENGTIMCLGWPDFKIGEEVRIADTDLSYYMEGVSHRFVVNKTYTMQLTATRGMPFAGGTGLGQKWDEMTPYKLPVTYPALLAALAHSGVSDPGVGIIDPGTDPSPSPAPR